MILHSINIFVLLIFFKSVDLTPISVCNDGVSFRDSKSCSKYYTCVKANEKYWTLEENHCPGSLLFEPSLNECKPDYLLITECLNSSGQSLNRESGKQNVSNSINVDNSHNFFSETDNFNIRNTDLKPINISIPNPEIKTKNSNDKDEVKYKSKNGPGVYGVENNNSANKNSLSTNSPTQSKVKKGKPMVRAKNSNGNKSATKRRNKKLPKKKKNKNWVAIFVRGCSSLGKPYEDDGEDQPDSMDEEQEEEQEAEPQEEQINNEENDKPDKNKLSDNNDLENISENNDSNHPKTNDSVNNNSNDNNSGNSTSQSGENQINNSNNVNRQKDSSSKNCACQEDKNHPSTSRPVLNHEKDSQLLNNSTTSTPNFSTSRLVLNHEKDSQLLNNSTTSTPNFSTESRLKQKVNPITPSDSNELHKTNESTTQTPINTSPLSSYKPTKWPIIKSTTNNSTQTRFTTLRPTSKATTTTKPTTTSPQSTPTNSSKIIFVKQKIRNPNNMKNGTQLSEKEQIDNYVNELKRRKPFLSEGRVNEIRNIFEEKMKNVGNIESNLLKEELNKPSMRIKEVEIKNFKIDKIADESNIEDFEKTMTILLNLADNSTNPTGRA